jgi:hypothetical protein
MHLSFCFAPAAWPEEYLSDVVLSPALASLMSAPQPFMLGSAHVLAGVAGKGEDGSACWTDALFNTPGAAALAECGGAARPGGAAVACGGGAPARGAPDMRASAPPCSAPSECGGAVAGGEAPGAGGAACSVLRDLAVTEPPAAAAAAAAPCTGAWPPPVRRVATLRRPFTWDC